RDGPLERCLRRRREALDELERLRIAAAVGAAIPEVGRLDDERVAFPVAAGVAHVEADAFGQMRLAAERDDPRLVNHLDPDRDEPLSLDDLVRIAVDGRQHRVRISARDAAVVEAEAVVVLVDAVAEAAARRRTARDALT